MTDEGISLTKNMIEPGRLLGVKLPKQAQSVLDYGERMFARDAFKKSLSEFEREMRD